MHKKSGEVWLALNICNVILYKLRDVYIIKKVSALFGIMWQAKDEIARIISSVVWKPGKWKRIKREKKVSNLQTLLCMSFCIKEKGRKLI